MKTSLPRILVQKKSLVWSRVLSEQMLMNIGFPSPNLLKIDGNNACGEVQNDIKGKACSLTSYSTPV